MSRCENCPLNASIKVSEERIAGFEPEAFEEEAANALKNYNDAVRGAYDGIMEELDCEAPEKHPETRQATCPFTNAVENALRFGAVNGAIPYPEGFLRPKFTRENTAKPPQGGSNSIVPNGPLRTDGTGQYL